MDGTTLDTQIEERRPECHKIQKLLRKTRRITGRDSEFDVIDISRPTEQPAEFHIREELNAEQREKIRSLL
jgi:hypothetical protein